MVTSGPGCYNATGEQPGVKTCEPIFADLVRNLITKSCELKGTIPATLTALSKLVMLRVGS